LALLTRPLEEFSPGPKNHENHEATYRADQGNERPFHRTAIGKAETQIQPTGIIEIGGGHHTGKYCNYDRSNFWAHYRVHFHQNTVPPKMPEARPTEG
jgi:hypothetical protein